jgi:dienelactone hydrolase
MMFMLLVMLLYSVGVTGHSMGGHGALTIALKNPTLYKYGIRYLLCT